MVYCAAGIWPSDGIHPVALNAETGAVVWQNSDSGAMVYAPAAWWCEREERRCRARLSGRLGRAAVCADRASCARSFDRRTGQFEYFHLQKYGHNGESLAMVVDDVLFNGGVGFDVSGGLRYPTWVVDHLPPRSGGVMRAFDGKMAEYRWQRGRKAGSQGPADKGSHADTAMECRCMSTNAQRSLPPAEQVVLGGRNKVVPVSMRNPKRSSGSHRSTAWLTVWHVRTASCWSARIRGLYIVLPSATAESGSGDTGDQRGSARAVERGSG